MSRVGAPVRFERNAPRRAPRVVLRRSALVVAVVTLLAGCANESRHRDVEDARADGMTEAAEHVRIGQFEEALRSYRRVLRHNPDNALAHFELGLLLQDHQREAGAALFHFQNYLDLRPEADKAGLAEERIQRARAALGRGDGGGSAGSGSRTVSDEQIVARMEELNAQIAERDRTITELREEITTLRVDNDRLGKEVASLDNRLRLLLDNATAVSRPASTALRDRTLDGVAAGTAERPPERTPAAERRPPPGARTYRVQRGDSLWSIAQKVYGDANRNVDIRNANPGQIGPNDRLREGAVLILP